MVSLFKWKYDCSNVISYSTVQLFSLPVCFINVCQFCNLLRQDSFHRLSCDVLCDDFCISVSEACL